MIDNAIWFGFGVTTFIVVMALAQVLPMMAEYDSECRSLVKLCRWMIKRVNPVVWLVLGCLLGPFAPMLLLSAAFAFDHRVR